MKLLDPVWVSKRIYEKYYVIPFYNRKHISSIKRLLTLTGFNISEYLEIIDEFQNLHEVHDYVNQQFKDTGLQNKFPPEKYSWPALIYFLIRKTNPEIVIETGCWYGNSTTCILSALNKNGKGKLYTIDLPALSETGGYYDENPYLSEKNRTSCLPAGKTSGFIIPDFLKDRWELILGPTSEKLLPLLSNLGQIDCFLHDSLHSYENMSFEFNLAYKKLNDNGFLISDNIDWNNCFAEFSKNKRAYSYLAYYESRLLKDNVGLIFKS